MISYIRLYLAEIVLNLAYYIMPNSKNKEKNSNNKEK